MNQNEQEGQAQPAAPQTYDQTNPESSQTVDPKAQDENEASQATLDIPDAGQTPIARSTEGDEPMLTTEEAPQLSVD